MTSNPDNEDGIRWPRSGSRRGGDYNIFSIRLDHSTSPLTGYSREYTVLETVDWVNVVAVTGEGKFILVRQFRHGTREYTLEIPGGGVDPDDGDPSVAALRELEEETGYVSDRAILIGVVEPNPAFQTNRCWTYLVPDAEPTGQIQPDPGEEIEVVIVSFDRLATLIREGTIRHALVVAAFHWYQEHIRSDSAAPKGDFET